MVTALRRLVQEGALDLPRPGSGETAARLRALAEVAAVDLSLARLAEGHTDALAIAAEARHAPTPGALYGVWAAEPPDARVRAERTPHGWRLDGRKRFASGAGGLGRALVTASSSDGARLFDVDLAESGVQPVADTWLAVGMAATGSCDVVFDGVQVSEDAAVGAPGFYLTRPGFWQGAVGVAACWYGGALGAYRMLRAQLGTRGADEHQAAHLGAIAASCITMWTSLEAAATAIDADPEARLGSGQERALVVRHVVEQGCQEVLARVGRAGGTSPLVFDHAHARRAADLAVYLRQHHAERDLAALGRMILAESPCR